MRGVVVLLLMAGCHVANDQAAIDAPPHDPYVQTLPDGPCSVDDVGGVIAGVTISIRSSSCVYRQGVEAFFTYDVTTDATVPPLEVPATTSCGKCGRYSTDPGSFVDWRIGGNATTGALQTYCICDTGCCPPNAEETIQPAATTVTETITWSGRNWFGPSDTGEVEGDYFPPGRYTVSVRFFGFAQGSVVAELPIEILDP